MYRELRQHLTVKLGEADLKLHSELREEKRMRVKRETKKMSSESIMVYVVMSSALGRLKLKIAINSRIQTVEDLSAYVSAHFGCKTDLRVCLSSREYFACFRETTVQLKPQQPHEKLLELEHKSQVILSGRRILLFFAELLGEQNVEQRAERMQQFWGFETNERKREAKLRRKLEKMRQRKKQVVDAIVSILQIITLRQGEKKAMSQPGDLDESPAEIERMKMLVKESLANDNDACHIPASYP